MKTRDLTLVLLLSSFLAGSALTTAQAETAQIKWDTFACVTPTSVGEMRNYVVAANIAMVEKFEATGACKIIPKGATVNVVSVGPARLGEALIEISGVRLYADSNEVRQAER
jgi:hypothetical protein